MAYHARCPSLSGQSLQWVPTTRYTVDLTFREAKCAKTLWIGSKSMKIGANAVTASEWWQRLPRPSVLGLRL
jgi:hypothetical protein